MPLRNQKAILAGNDLLGDLAVKKIAPRYREETLGPLALTIELSRSPEEAMQRLNAGLVRTMRTTALENAIAETEFQAGLIGRVAATPRALPRRQ